jgi:hypothetical protein
MNVYVMTFLFSVITYGLGYYAGNSDGKVEGRMAVRRHYEGVIAAERRINESTNYQLRNAYKDQA